MVNSGVAGLDFRRTLGSGLRFPETVGGDRAYGVAEQVD